MQIRIRIRCLFISFSSRTFVYMTKLFVTYIHTYIYWKQNHLKMRRLLRVENSTLSTVCWIKKRKRERWGQKDTMVSDIVAPKPHISCCSKVKFQRYHEFFSKPLLKFDDNAEAKKKHNWISTAIIHIRCLLSVACFVTRIMYITIIIINN